MDEKDYLFRTLDCISSQQCDYPIEVFVCVNQPEDWWNQPEKLAICENNSQTIFMLKDYPTLSVKCIDKSSKGKAWANTKQGVGLARKELTQAILASASSDNDILISMDADTLFEPDHCQSVVENFRSHPSAVAMAVPYYHKKNNSESETRAMLRYEIYMRNYNLQLLHINSPYAYTALGSAIACRMQACKAVNGFDSHTSGEDFYFLQKLCKYGRILRYNHSKVYPATRFSDRVPFGTGPAIYNGSQGNFASYPIFHHSGFEVIKQVYKQIDRLFYEDFENEFLYFLNNNSHSGDIWTPLRKNYKTLPLFTKAFHTKVDSLRIFQFIRNYQQKLNLSDEQCLAENLQYDYPNQYNNLFEEKKTFSFSETSIQQLDKLRDFLMKQETNYQKQMDMTLMVNE